MTESVWYATREDVKTASDVVSTSRVDAIIDRAIASASRFIEGETLRRFYPWDGTRTFDWPIPVSRWWILELEDNELTAVSTLVSGGVTLTRDVDYYLRPDNAPALRAPFTRVEINLAGTGSFNIGPSIQRAIQITGTFGYTNEQVPVGTVTADTTAGSGQVVLSSSAGWGVGSILIADAERMIVTGRRQAATGQTITADLAEKLSATLVPVPTPADFTLGETILVDTEQMLVLDATDTALIVQRQWNGSVLGAHTSGAAVYAARTAVVTRGALGTTAVDHAADTAVTVVVIPEGVRQWCIGQALVDCADQLARYARPASRGGGAPDTPRPTPEQRGAGLPELAARAMAAYGRGPRMGVAL